MVQKNQILESLYYHEIAKSTRLRTLILIGLLVFVGLSLLLIYLSFDKEYIEIFKSNIPIYALLIFALIIITYELVVHYLVTWRSGLFNLRTKFSAYSTTFSEIGLLSLLLVAVVEYSEESAIMHSPAILTYFILIILSTLHLDFRLSVFSGFLVAAEYVGISLYYDKIVAPVTNMSFSLSTIRYLGTGIMMVTAGISAGFVARLIKSKMLTSLRTKQEKSKVIDSNKAIFAQ